MPNSADIKNQKLINTADNLVWATENTPELPTFRALQWLAIAIALLFLLAGLLLSQYVIHAAQNKLLSEINVNASQETDYITRDVEQEFRQAENLATTLSLETSIIKQLADINKIADPLSTLPAEIRYDLLIKHRDVIATNLYFTRLASAIDIQKIYLINNSGFCVASSQWQDPHACIGGKYDARKYFTQAKKNGHAMQFAVGLQVHIPSFFFASIIKTGNQFIGESVVRLDAAELSRVFARDDKLSLVVDGNGMIVASSDQLLILKHLGKVFGKIPSVDEMTNTYKINKLEAIGINKAADSSFDQSLWDYKNNQYLLTSAKVANKDLYVMRFISSAPLNKLSNQYWLAAIGLLSFGLLFILLVERSLNFAKLKKAHLSSLSAANLALNKTANRFYELAISDSMTGLRNHRFFMQRLNEEIAFAHENNTALAFIALDIDRFKLINDTYGHGIGDEVILSLGESCMRIVRAHDTVGRLGGEEFAILLPNADMKNALEIAERIRQWCESHKITVNGKNIGFTCSFGVGCLMPNWYAKTLLEEVDKAMYEAKRGGRNRVVAVPACLV